MIVKILSSSSNEFHGVQYNDKKIEKGTGELTLMKNFPSHIDGNSSKEDVKNYLKSISQSNKTKKPQFHATISTKYQEHSKEELTQIGENFMKEMGYGNQPYIIVFHNDTENNHIHLVSTRVDKTTGKKINDQFEKLKSQRALQKAVDKVLGENEDRKLENILSYRIRNFNHLSLLLERNGFKLVEDENSENKIHILKNGVRLKSLDRNQILFENKSNKQRILQIKAYLEKYKEKYSNKVFKVIDNREQELTFQNEKENPNRVKIEFESELQEKMRAMFGVDIVFHWKGNHTPFGYSLIDNKTGEVFKGSEILKMKDLFEITDENIDKRLFERLKDYNIYTEKHKQLLIKYLKQEGENIADFMVFENRVKKDIETYRQIKSDTIRFLRNKNIAIKILKDEEGNEFVIHPRLHFLGKIKDLVGENIYQNYLQEGKDKTFIFSERKEKGDLEKAIDEFLFEISQSSGGIGIDPLEEERKRRKKRKR